METFLIKRTSLAIQYSGYTINILHFAMFITKPETIHWIVSGIRLSMSK